MTASVKHGNRPGGAVHGVLVVDKPPGMTSHDVVAKLRRTYRTRKVGHAGTLDPMATGVLVLLFGEATKLSSVLTTDAKAYEAEVQFGVGTDSLDADGRVTRRVELAEDWEPDLGAALAQERSRNLQVPPVVSAIRVDGKRAHALARAGEQVALEPRPVRVHSLEASWVAPARVRAELRVSKGYYVRSLARDLGDLLGAPAHLVRLRRTASGRFSLDQAIELPERPVALMSLSRATQLALPTVELTPEGKLRAEQGKPLNASDLEAPPTEPGASTWAAHRAGRVVALLEPGREPGSFRVKRGIHDPGPPGGEG